MPAIGFEREKLFTIRVAKRQLFVLADSPHKRRLALVKRVPKKQGQQRNQSSPKFSFRRWSIVVCLAALMCIAGGLLYSKSQRPKNGSEIARASRNSDPKPGTLNELLALSPAEIERCDIARLNLLCAEGL